MNECQPTFATYLIHFSKFEISNFTSRLAQPRRYAALAFIIITISTYIHTRPFVATLNSHAASPHPPSSDPSGGGGNTTPCSLASFSSISRHSCLSRSLLLPPPYLPSPSVSVVSV